MKLQRTTTYREQSRVLLAQAYEDLEKGDFVQASEKGWDAAAQMVKAIADERGWRHFSHRDLYKVLDLLHQETGDTELADLFNAGSSLHVNFYENAYSRDTIGNNLRQVQRFVDKAEGLLGATPRAEAG